MQAPLAHNLAGVYALPGHLLPQQVAKCSTKLTGASPSACASHQTGGFTSNGRQCTGGGQRSTAAVAAQAAAQTAPTVSKKKQLVLVAGSSRAAWPCPLYSPKLGLTHLQIKLQHYASTSWALCLGQKASKHQNGRRGDRTVRFGTAAALGHLPAVFAKHTRKHKHCLQKQSRV